MAQTSVPTIQISRKGMFIWIGLVFFISFWMFVLGVMVGRGMAPVNLESGKQEKELAQLKAEMVEQEQVEAAHQEKGQSAEKPKLEFYEALKEPSKVTGFKPQTPVQSPDAKPAAKPTPAPASAAVKEIPQKSAIKQPKTRSKSQPSDAPKESPRSPNQSTEGQYSVQVAAVQDIKAAGKLVDELRGRGYHAYQIRSDVADKGVWYRIRVGGFEDRGAAEEVLHKLKGDKYGGIVVSTK